MDVGCDADMPGRMGDLWYKEGLHQDFCDVDLPMCSLSGRARCWEMVQRGGQGMRGGLSLSSGQGCGCWAGQGWWTATVWCEDADLESLRRPEGGDQRQVVPGEWPV